MRHIKVIFCAFLLAVFLPGCNTNHQQQQSKEPASPSYLSERKQMVQQQIMDRGIRDKKIIDAFLKVKRHEFVPKRYIDNAYEDRPLPIGEGQTISQPYIVAYMTQVLDLSRTDKVLEIGTGSGYQAAILGELSDNVFTIEINEPLGKKAKRLLKDLGYSNVKVKIGDGYKGWKEHAPFDAIIVTCSPSRVPEPLKEQLKEGGRMIIPVGEAYHQKLVYMLKIDNELKQQSEIPVMFVPMVDSTGKPY
ncbi:MAG TPA: protein-L-isoaspartate(D-aspartate) O-methyltransferase [Nitrospirae bacterium]|nr:protein-L-isoaspartate(D-aspartate) O-methyltransferase [Nitrospirota bacterium]HDK17135.1 protein-L-isoaspartate(D-aspartate) O-methyltransferase [Nitrospirota bacterium]HDK81098.1 protein-L-isoaspartate(D-aspartate) O-methyltransferase [Nitrospirota bacterium]HDO25571.1 protein-L-isoaspartate(D-aspartate) O-methyltransferase [Nitrospirota bacterium]